MQSVGYCECAGRRRAQRGDLDGVAVIGQPPLFGGF
jgi:hypothetical protein